MKQSTVARLRDQHLTALINGDHWIAELIEKKIAELRKGCHYHIREGVTAHVKQG